MKTATLLASFVLASSAVACGAADGVVVAEGVDTSAPADTLSLASPPAALHAAATPEAPTGGAFFVVTRPDLRRCVAPLCGGVFVKRVNQAQTRCADGTLAADCYVTSLDFAALGFGEALLDEVIGEVNGGAALVRGRLDAFTALGRPLAKLVVTEAWEPRLHRAASGVVSRVTADGVVLRQTPVNGQGAASAVTNILFPAGTLADDLRTELLADIDTRAGILVAGEAKGGRNPRLVASEVYTKVTVPKAPAFCGGIAGFVCADGFYCKFAPQAQCGAADQTGTCERVGTSACTRDYLPVCGCDDVTYANACLAAAAGISARPGACEPTLAQQGESCGGRRISGGACAEGLFCNFAPAALCGRADATGVCEPRGLGICTLDYTPVCGCNGETYSNACGALAAGVSVDHDGVCE